MFSRPVDAFGVDWQEEGSTQAIHWYSTSGADLGRSSDTKLKDKLNFLNPDQETFAQLWGPHGSTHEEPSTGNDGPLRITKYSRFAIVAWPFTRHVENALKSMSVEHSWLRNQLMLQRSARF